MNFKRLVLAIVVAFIFIFATDFLIHAVWLKQDYLATRKLWRPEAEMNALAAKWDDDVLRCFPNACTHAWYSASAWSDS